MVTKQQLRRMGRTAAEELMDLGLLSRPGEGNAEQDVFRKTETSGAARESADYGPVQLIPLEKIHRRPTNRGGRAVTATEVTELADSIGKFGLSRPVELRTTSELQELPIGHYELVKGERRVAACRRLGWEQVPAFVFALAEPQAAVQAAIDNTQAVALDPIQRAKEIRDAIEAGVSEEDAAAAAGVPKGGKNALRLLELPESIQRHVSDGTITQKLALAIVPYVKLPPVMEAMEKAIRMREWWIDEARDDYRPHIEHLVERHTRRPASELPKVEAWERPRPAVPDKLLTPELREELGEVKVRVNNKPTTIFTNVAKYDELAAAAEAEAKTEADNRKRKQQAKAEAEGVPANPEAARKQDERLQMDGRLWRHAFLRLCIASELVAGDPRTAAVDDWLRRACNRGGVGHGAGHVEHLDAEIAAYLRRPVKRDRYHPGTGWDLTQSLLRWGEDPFADRDEVELLRSKWTLWPQEDWDAGDGLLLVSCSQPVPMDLLVPLDFEEVEAVAKWLHKVEGPRAKDVWKTSFADGWARAARPGPERIALQQLIVLCNKRQLIGLAAEMGVSESLGERLGEMQDRLLDFHVDKQRFKIPKLVAEAK